MTSKTSMKMTLRDVLTREWFTKAEAVFSSRYGLTLESVGPDGRSAASLSSAPCHPYFCRLIRESRPGTARCYKNRMRWMNLAQKSGKPYIGVCHAGMVLACVPIVYRNKRLGGIFFGKCLIEKSERLMRQEFRRRFKGFHYNWFLLGWAMERLKVIDERKLARAGEFLQSQLKQMLVPEKAAALRKQKALRLAGKARKEKRLREARPDAAKSPCIRYAMDYMDSQYDLPVKLRELAEFAELSVFHFAHLFRRETGLTPVDYLTRVRIHHAKRLLTTTDWEYWQVSKAVGYNHQSYFIRMFKRLTGTTPQRFRLRKNMSPVTSRSGKRGIFQR
jgi:AraC-like DNA-binding protein/ligand-binding sensor protein